MVDQGTAAIVARAGRKPSLVTFCLAHAEHLPTAVMQSLRMPGQNTPFLVELLKQLRASCMAKCMLFVDDC